MDICPHCGEPVDPKAECCPNCGSDSETGWNEDVDYYSVEIPEDDLQSGEETPTDDRHAWLHWLGPALLTLAVLAFLLTGERAYGWNVFLLLAVLAACGLAYRVGFRT